jgi:catechol 2,3-dioxygenase-like lactoylglutathione lyase family enzyme
MWVRARGLRIFDEARARDFYVEYLGFAVDWEHRFGGRGPLYTLVSRGSLVLHLSEHHGDGSPGHVVYVAAKRRPRVARRAANQELPVPQPRPGDEPR